MRADCRVVVQSAALNLLSAPEDTGALPGGGGFQLDFTLTSCVTAERPPSLSGPQCLTREVDSNSHHY